MDRRPGIENAGADPAAGRRNCRDRLHRQQHRSNVASDRYGPDHPQRPRLAEADRGARLLYHGHCHEKALWGTEAAASLMRRGVAPEGEIGLDDYPDVRAWIERVQALPGYVSMEGIDPVSNQT